MIGKPFKKGEDENRHDPRLAKAGIKREKKIPPPTTTLVPPPEDGAPQALQDARFVYQNEEGHDSARGQGVRNMREFWKKDPKAFVAQMMSLESEHRDRTERAAREKQEKAGGEEEDLGTEKCVALCVEWLKANGVNK